MNLINNTKLAEQECRWCDSFNEPHSPACPVGERYKQIQLMGGVPIPVDKNVKKIVRAKKVMPPPSYEGSCCLECGVAVEDYDLTCNECNIKLSK